MRKRRLVFISLLFVLIGAVATAFYLFFQPHRDIKNAEAEYVLSSEALVAEYLTDKAAADLKYLDEEGESAIVELTGRFLSAHANGPSTVIVLEGVAGKSDVHAHLSTGETVDIAALEGKQLRLKGVLISGPEFDADLELYTPLILRESSIIN